jgi:hypothetical protein
MATVAVGLAFRPTRRNPEGVARWLCDACFADEPDGEPVRHYRSGARQSEAVPVALQTIERPVGTVARMDWWEQPVGGWREGKLTISPMVGNETYEIDLD